MSSKIIIKKEDIKKLSLTHGRTRGRGGLNYSISSCSYIPPGHFYVSAVCWHFLTVSWQPHDDMRVYPNFEFSDYTPSFFQNIVLR